MLSLYWATFEKLFGHMHGNIIVYIRVIELETTSRPTTTTASTMTTTTRRPPSTIAKGYYYSNY